MAASDSSLSGHPPSGMPTLSPAKPDRRNQVIVGAVCLVVILVAAAFAGATSGWDTIGRGGINRSLLPKVGEPAPDFTTEDVFGNPVSLSQFKGQPVWLMFWGSWCPPCREEPPPLEEFQQQHGDAAFTILGIDSGDLSDDGKAFVDRYGLSYPQLNEEVAPLLRRKA